MKMRLIDRDITIKKVYIKNYKINDCENEQDDNEFSLSWQKAIASSSIDEKL